MDVRIYIAESIEKLNRQRVMITAALSIQHPELSRKQRMDWPLTYDGKKLSVIAYLNKLGESIPDMREASTGKSIDHRQRLIQDYLEFGVSGVDVYLKDCVKILAKTLTHLGDGPEPTQT